LVVQFLHGDIHNLHSIGDNESYGYICDGHVATHFCVLSVLFIYKYLYILVVLQVRQKVAVLVHVRQFVSHNVQIYVLFVEIVLYLPSGHF
jgi:hypothetical protein